MNSTNKVDNEKPTETSKAGDAVTAEPGAEAAAPVKEMKAVILTSHGGLRGMKVLNKPEPVAGEGEVTIRVKACGLGFPDLMLRQGAIDLQVKPPFIMGTECAGEIESVGDSVTELSVGDRVCALTELRAWAEVVSVPAKFVYKLPKKMDWKEAVAVTLNYVVAQALLFDIGNLRSGQTIFIQSVGGGVGQALAQLARTVPDVTIIATASKHKHEILSSSVNQLFDHSTDYVADIKKVYPDGVDLALDCTCGDETNRAYNLLKPMGRYVLYGTAFIVSGETKSLFSFAKSWWQVDKVSPLKLFDDNKSICGFNLRRLLFHQDGHAYVRSLVEKVYSLWGKKKISPILDSCWAFEDIPEAMQKMHDRRNIGKIVIDPAQEPKPKSVEVETEAESRTSSLRWRKASSKEKSLPETKDLPAISESGKPSEENDRK